jgi:hypothetical protein
MTAYTPSASFWTSKFSCGFFFGDEAAEDRPPEASRKDTASARERTIRLIESTSSFVALTVRTRTEKVASSLPRGVGFVVFPPSFRRIRAAKRIGSLANRDNRRALR